MKKQSLKLSIFIFSILTMNINAQWTGVNPLLTNSDVGISINTMTGAPEGKLHIHQFQNSQNFGANKKHLVLGLACDNTGMSEPIFLSPITSNDFSIEPNCGGDLDIFKLESRTNSMNINGPIVSYTGTKFPIVSFGQNRTLFHSGLYVEGAFSVNLLQNATTVNSSLVVNGVSTFNDQINASDITVNNLNVNNIISPKLSIGAKKPTGTYANYSLSVDGTIVSKKEIVQISSWADKVFQKNYHLMPLSEVEAYVAKNKHLPEIPSESEVIENGVDVAEMNKLLLQKVEELTLHLIEQEKKIKKLEAKVGK